MMAENELVGEFLCVINAVAAIAVLSRVLKRR